ncbi:hypothetical protein [Corynebacterium epidermidicanis]|uniref:Lipoprotein n=1 Tax=Corynebacterium epidermidicanis TaxID=1050174 RepID=A0A0G3GU24_9CORY|nr:hypothetical protein [Corynebacterium epidermidicanis]AKK02367.1 hypothetical protein CEPID_02430 [Corynebacterium epidermidicanis]
MRRKISLMVATCFTTMFLFGCGNDVQTKWIGQVAIKKVSNDRVAVLINPCDAPLMDVRFTATSPSQRFAKLIPLDSPHASPFEMSYSIDPNATDSLPIFTQNIGEFHIYAVAPSADTRTRSVHATREELLALKDGELITGDHQVSNIDKFAHCQTRFNS